MYSFTITTSIGAHPSTVWRALCDPREVIKWDTGVTEALDAPPDYPQPGQHVRWQYAAGPFRTLHDRPHEVASEKRLRSLISLGPIRFDETYTLEPDDAGTLLVTTMRVVVPLVLGGPVTERAYVGPASRRAVAASMAALKRHCEAQL